MKKHHVYLVGILFLVNGMSCENSGYVEIPEGDLPGMEFKAEVESVLVNPENLREAILKINNKGARVSFSVYNEWYSSQNLSRYSLGKIDSGYLCDQYEPRIHDSLFKRAGESEIEVFKSLSTTMDTIMLVKRAQVQRVMKAKFRTP